jgi:hypothetical protein
VLLLVLADTRFDQYFQYRRTRFISSAVFVSYDKFGDCEEVCVAQALTLAYAEACWLMKQAPAGVPVPHQFGRSRSN